MRIVSVKTHIHGVTKRKSAIGLSAELRWPDHPIYRVTQFLPASPWRTFSQLVRALEFRRQFPRVQILADVREPLLQLLQRVAKFLRLVMAMSRHIE